MKINIRDEYTNLDKYLRQIYNKYIKPHKDNEVEDVHEDYILDLKCYCTLAHAAFEEFIENICKYLIEEMIDNLKTNGRISWCTLCFFCFYVDKLAIKEADLQTMRLPHNNILFKKLLTKACEAYNSYLQDINNNHGINIKYLLHLLPSVGLDIPNDTIKINSLSKLTESRGVFAHHYSISRLTRIASLDDVKNYVDDVKDIVSELYEKALNMYYYLHNFNT